MGEASSASYIRMVQHLIEQCLVFNMNKEECMKALSRNASVNPVVTSTVWQELEKENREFFRAYREDQEERALEKEAAERAQKQIAEAAARESEDDDEEGN